MHGPIQSRNSKRPSLGAKTKSFLGGLKLPESGLGPGPWAEVDRTGVLLDPKMLLAEAILSDQFIKGQLKYINGANAPFAPCPIRPSQRRSQS